MTSFAQQSAENFCGKNQPAKQLAQLVINHPNQERPAIECNQLLTEIAQQRAEQLGNNNNDPEITPNQVLIKGGFRVPNYYPVTGNQVEAVARDFKQANSALKYLNESSKHHDQVMGSGDFFSRQSQLGIGFFEATEVTQHDQWVVLTAEPWQSAQFVIKQELSMPVKIAEGCDKNWQNSNNQYLIRKCQSLGRSRVDHKVDPELKCDATSCEKQ